MAPVFLFGVGFMLVKCVDGLEDLSEYSYIYKKDVFRRGNLYYKFRVSCSVCGSPFFMRTSMPTNFCSVKCSNNSTAVKTKISISLKNYNEKYHRNYTSKGNYKGGVVAKNLPLFDTYAHQLKPIEETRQNSASLLEVRCSVCGEWYIPKRTDVEARAQYLKGNVDRESRFYCSEPCKNSCSVFNKRKYPNGFNPRKYRNNKLFTENELRIWSNEVLIRADYRCEYCEGPATSAHHIVPKKLGVFEALDPDNGIACCNECHYKYGHKGECSTINIANKIC